jgi:hypothetical protein
VIEIEVVRNKRRVKGPRFGGILRFSRCNSRVLTSVLSCPVLFQRRIVSIWKALRQRIQCDAVRSGDPSKR